jgi:hypothetical protein
MRKYAREPRLRYRHEARWAVRHTGPTGFYRLKRFKYFVCNIYDATLKIIAVAKVKANIVIHICSSIAWQAGARPVSQPPAPVGRRATLASFRHLLRYSRGTAEVRYLICPVA